jgi:hypothetical protein
MAVVVSLHEVVNALDMQSEEWTVYLNTATGKIVTISDDDRRLAEEDVDPEELPAWQRDALPEIRESLQALEDGRLLSLPDKFEIHEWDIMRRFADCCADPKQQEELTASIHGSGAFRRFHDCVRRLGVQEEWFRFRDETLQQIAKDWLAARGIPYQ